MKIPIFEEISVNPTELDSLPEKIRTRKSADCPAYFLLKGVKLNVQLAFLNELKKVLQREGLHPFFPFPLYIVSDKLLTDDLIPIVPTVDELPRHFYSKVKRPKKEEIDILAKNAILVERLRNLDLFAKQALLNRRTSDRELYELTRESYFYEKILEEIRREEDKL